jgi:hypothetical protein
MVEGQIEVHVRSARLNKVKPNKEDVYAIVTVGRKMLIGEETGLTPDTTFPKKDDHAAAQERSFDIFNSRQVINVILYIRPRQKRAKVEVDEFGKDRSGGQAGGSVEDGGIQRVAAQIPSQGFQRTPSLNVAGVDGEGAMAKLIKRKEVLVGKGKPPNLFDRVTISEEFCKVYISPVEPGRIGTIFEVKMGGLECLVQWDPLPETPPKTPHTPPTHLEKEAQTINSYIAISPEPSSLRGDVANKGATGAAALYILN